MHRRLTAPISVLTVFARLATMYPTKAMVPKMIWYQRRPNKSDKRPTMVKETVWHMVKESMIQIAFLLGAVGSVKTREAAEDTQSTYEDPLQ